MPAQLAALSSCRDFAPHRLFDAGNHSWANDESVYALELGLHEMMLQSPHRTLDPEVGPACCAKTGSRSLFGIILMRCQASVEAFSFLACAGGRLFLRPCLHQSDHHPRVWLGRRAVLLLLK